MLGRGDVVIVAFIGLAIALLFSRRQFGPRPERRERVRKTIAAISASVLGIGGAVMAGAAPASAAMPTCTDATQHVLNPNVTAGDTWYMPCIPQYGMGKAEFTITTPASDPFPADYSLADGHQTVTSTPTQTQVHDYFEPLWEEFGSAGGADFSGAFANITEDTADATATSQPYVPDFLEPSAMDVAFPIVSVGLAAAGLPASCTPMGSGATYQGEYEVTYGSTTTHFSQTIDDVARSVTITYTPAPLYIGLNFTGGAGDEEFDTTMPICASSGGNTTFAADESDIDWDVAAYNATNLPPVLETLSPASGDLSLSSDPAEVIAATTSDLGSFTETSTPVLATTGVNTEPDGTLGAGLLSVGILATLVGVVRRRRRLPINSR
jgi:hypothetical protein